MKINDIVKKCDNTYRILDKKDNKYFVIECTGKRLPYWIDKEELSECEKIENNDFLKDIKIFDLTQQEKAIMNKRFTIIAEILPVIENEKARSKAITRIAEEYNISRPTVRQYLCNYLIYQSKEALVPKRNKTVKPITQDERNMHWALQKFFYTSDKNTLKTAYTMMIKEKYCTNGKLNDEYPTFYQFRYFYRKTKNIQKQIITRNGIKYYQRNERPCTGDGVQQFAPAVGVGMLDATICDIYLVNEAGNIIGRPILTVCVDAYSGICCGYSLTLEGGVYSLRNLMLNVISDKVEHCKKFGISISKNKWNCESMPAKLITDMGTEYTSETFAQLSELGIQIVNLPPYRPDMKGPVEKFFDLIQGYFKPYLKGKGLIEPDYKERGTHDYRKDACLTMEDFEKVVLRCIIFYNSSRIVENFPYTEEMLKAKVKPYANELWKWGRNIAGCNLLEIEKEELILTLLPRTTGRFSRFGLKVNKMRYHNENYNEKYLEGKTAVVSYNPDDTTYVWLKEDGYYTRFELIESRYKEKDLEEVMNMKSMQNSLVNMEKENRLQAEIELAEHIQDIALVSKKSRKTECAIKNIRNTRRKERDKRHIDYGKGVVANA